MKKILSVMESVLIISFVFAGVEYLLYGLKVIESGLFYPAFLFFLLCIVLCIEILNRLHLFSKLFSSIITLTAIFVGFGIIKIIFSL